MADRSERGSRARRARRLGRSRSLPVSEEAETISGTELRVNDWPASFG